MNWIIVEIEDFILPTRSRDPYLNLQPVKIKRYRNIWR